MEKIVGIALAVTMALVAVLMVLPGLRGWEHYSVQDDWEVIDIQWQEGYYLKETYDGKYELHRKDDFQDERLSWIHNFADYEEGLAPVPIGDDRKYGYVNHEGMVVIAPVFDYASAFYEGLAEVEVDGLSGYIDLNGEFVIEPRYYSGGYFMNGYATVAIEGGWVEGMSGESLDSGLWGLIDTDGRVVIEPQYGFLWREQDYANLIAEEDGMYGLVDRDNNIQIPFEYDNMWFENKADGLYIWAEKADSYFYFDTKDPSLTPVATEDKGFDSVMM